MRCGGRIPPILGTDAAGAIIRVVREMLRIATGHGQDGRGTLPSQSGAFAIQDPRQGGGGAVAVGVVGVDGDGFGVEGGASCRPESKWSA